MTDDESASESFYFNAVPVAIMGNEPIAASLLRAGILATRSTRKGIPRGIYCGIGICNDCLVRISGRGNLRACMIQAEPGLEVSSG